MGHPVRLAVRAASGRRPRQALRNARQPVDWRSTAPGVEDLDLLRAEAATARTVELDRPPVYPADSRCPTTVRAVLPGDPLTRFHRVASRSQRAGRGPEGSGHGVRGEGRRGTATCSPSCAFQKRVVLGRLVPDRPCSGSPQCCLLVGRYGPLTPRLIHHAPQPVPQGEPATATFRSAEGSQPPGKRRNDSWTSPRRPWRSPSGHSVRPVSSGRDAGAQSVHPQEVGQADRVGRRACHDHHLVARDEPVHRQHCLVDQPDHLLR